VEDYADKIPFAFIATLNKLVVVLEPLKLIAESDKDCFMWGIWAERGANVLLPSQGRVGRVV
jgi:hypothetical protein